MTSAAELHTAALALLRAVPTIGVYDGKVPDSPPADASGRTYPYVVVWPSAGHYPKAEAGALCATPGDELTWPGQFTVAAGESLWVLQAAALVRKALAGKYLTPLSGPLVEDEVSVPVQVDPVVKPARFFVPMIFRTTGA